MPAPLGHPNYDTEGKAGRPKKYTTEYIEQLADELIIWIKKESNFWVKDFCLEKGIDPRLMTDWCKENERFSEALSIAKAFQESRIFKWSMLNKFNSTMSKFALINNHGWVDKTETKVLGDQANPLSFLMQQADGKSKDLVKDD